MFIDVYWRVCSDSGFRKQVRKLGEDILALEKSAMTNARLGVQLHKKIEEFYVLCNNNPGLLVPHFFPNYPERGKALSLFARPFSFSMFNFQTDGFTVIRASRQVGKEQPYSALVLTPSGFVKMGSLKIGDLVIGRDGRSHPIIGITEQGISGVYKLTFTDESTAECGLDHNWVIRGNGSKHWKTETLRAILDKKGGFNPVSDQAIRIPLSDPVMFSERSHVIHPYVLGLLIGDGTLTSSIPRFTTVDLELLEFIKQDMPNVMIKKITDNDYDLADPVKWKRSELSQSLHDLDLQGKTAISKTIPKEYLMDSVANRIALLRGLLDTDGSIFGKCQIEYYTISPELAKDVQFLVQSLGGTARIKTKPAWYADSEGKRIDCNICYRVKISRLTFNPFRLKRKAAKFYQIKYEKTRVLRSIELVRQEQSRCICVDSDDHTYLTNNFIVTHNSTSLAARQLMNAHILPGYRSLYIVPHEEHRKTYANRLREMEMAFLYFTHTPHHRQNLNYKEYPNGSIIELIRVLTTAAESRGKTTDEILFDEYQHFDDSLEPEVDQTQKASRIPSKIYSGTSLTVDTPLETQWLRSSQGEWHIRAMDGKHWINTGDKDEVLRIIQQKGPTCPYTNRILDVTDGVYVHRFPELLKEGKVGLHIPQVIIPDLVLKANKWKQIWDSFTNYNIKSFLQEVLGIPTMEGAREISLEELKAMCVLPYDRETRRRMAKSRYYRHIVSGCDWGGSDYNPSDKTKVSYTVHVILGLTVDDKIDILHMRQYSGMNYREVADDIVFNHNDFCATAIASDFGVGAAYNMLLREKLPADRHFILAYTGPRTAPLSAPQGYGWFNQYSLNRTESITQLYSAIKQDSPRIRCYAWDEAESLLTDFMNLYRIPTEGSTGSAEFKYRRHGSKPDDTLHAVNFAYTLMRLVMGEPLLEDRGLLIRVVDQLKGRASFGPPFGGPPRVIVG